MTCFATHPEHGSCRITNDNHSRHVSGFGKAIAEWPNEDYLPPPPRTSLRRMAEIANELRRGLTV